MYVCMYDEDDWVAEIAKAGRVMGAISSFIEFLCAIVNAK